MPKTDIVNKKKDRRTKIKKDKKPFLNEKEWAAQEEEDDEMVFIEEHVEDD